MKSLCPLTVLLLLATVIFQQPLPASGVPLSRLTTALGARIRDSVYLFDSLSSTDLYDASSNVLTRDQSTEAHSPEDRIQKDIEKKKKRKKKKKSICEDLEWRAKALKLVKEIPIAGLFRDLSNQTKFEASGVDYVDGHFYVVFDSIRSLGYLDDRFEFRSPNNLLIGEIGDESQFEGISYRPDADTFITIQESHDHHGLLQPLAEELKVSEDKSSYEVVRRCRVDFNLTHENKGFESINFHDGGEKGKFLLGLCEGNGCTGGDEGREPGKGRLVVSRLEEGDNGTCRWAVQKLVHIPESAYFADYSGMAFRGSKIAITSQEDGALWVGKFDWEEMEFVGKGEIFHFPRDNQCDPIYCNIEGVAWIDDFRLVFASDQAKADQPFQCVAKDQSIHIFMLPAQ